MNKNIDADTQNIIARGKIISFIPVPNINAFLSISENTTNGFIFMMLESPGAIVSRGTTKFDRNINADPVMSAAITDPS